MASRKSGPSDGLLEDGDLVPQCEVLGGDRRASDNECPEEKEGGLNDTHDVLLVTNGSSYWTM